MKTKLSERGDKIPASYKAPLRFRSRLRPPSQRLPAPSAANRSFNIVVTRGLASTNSAFDGRRIADSGRWRAPFRRSSVQSSRTIQRPGPLPILYVISAQPIGSSCHQRKSRSIERTDRSYRTPIRRHNEREVHPELKRCLCRARRCPFAHAPLGSRLRQEVCTIRRRSRGVGSLWRAEVSGRCGGPGRDLEVVSVTK